MDMRTPLKRVRHLGSAKEGTDHFWQQRVTGVANVFFAVWLVWLIASLAGASHETLRQTLANPLVAIGLIALIISSVYHMRLGMQVIIEDYVHAEAAKIVLVMANTFFAMAVGLASVYAILKLGFGG